MEKRSLRRLSVNQQAGANLVETALLLILILLIAIPAVMQVPDKPMETFCEVSVALNNDGSYLWRYYFHLDPLVDNISYCFDDTVTYGTNIWSF